MESALRVVSQWAYATSVAIADRPCNILVDNPTDQAYEVKEYLAISRDVQSYLDHLEFEGLLAGLMKS
jgi:hypothetical protein